MADVYDKAKRSAVMSAVRSKGNKDTELVMIRLLRTHRLSGWRRNQPHPGKPDFVFPRERVALFIDGCFWHACPRHGRKPASNTDYWLPKLERNRARDKKVNCLLKSKGWQVLRIWEHDLKKEEKIISKLAVALKRPSKAF